MTKGTGLALGPASLHAPARPLSPSLPPLLLFSMYTHPPTHPQTLSRLSRLMSSVRFVSRLSSVSSVSS
jgi:hypothetical protein